MSNLDPHELLVEEELQHIATIEGANHVRKLGEPLIEAVRVLVRVPEDVLDLDRTQARHNDRRKLRTDWLSLVSSCDSKRARGGRVP